jgi:ribonuclease BN (tRNA processing enzyme)
VPRVTVLGSGDAFGAGGRLFGCYLVETSSATFLLECGPTVLQGLKRVQCDPGCLDFVLVSHLHGDHFGGIPFLLMEYRYEAPRTRPLALYGPADLGARVDALFRALYRSIAVTASPFEIRFEEARPGQSFRVQDVVIEPFGVSHVPELSCLGYRVIADGKTVCFSGDSAWGPELMAAAAGADLFLCECSTYETRLDIHVAYPEVAKEAASLACRRVVLTHLGSEVLGRGAALDLECATDGMTIDL